MTDTAPTRPRRAPEETRVLITGAAGLVGRCLRRELAGRYPRLVLLDRDDAGPAGPAEVIVRMDIADLGGLRAAFTDVDVVIHLAGIPDEAPFDDLLMANFVGTRNVFEAARRTGVGRVIFASTNHVVGFYERSQQVGPDDPMRPDTMYAVTKGAGELVARLYHDKYGLDVVVVRIGSLRAAPENRRQLKTWLSEGDAGELFIRCVEAPIGGYRVVFGVSAVNSPWWRNPAAALLGYVAQDTPAVEALSAREPAEEGRAGQLQGGRFTDADYRGGLGRPGSA